MIDPAETEATQACDRYAFDILCEVASDTSDQATTGVEISFARVALQQIAIEQGPLFAFSVAALAVFGARRARALARVTTAIFVLALVCFPFTIFVIGWFVANQN